MPVRFSATLTGAYTYTLDNSNSDVQGLNASETLTESFTVSVSDGTATTSTTLRFTINGANDTPTGLALSASTVAENSAGATIGTLSATDTDGDSLTYTLATGGDNDSFEINGTTLKLKDSVSANYEANNVYDLTITVTDGTASQSISQEVTVTNVDEANTSYYYGKADTNASAKLNAQNNAAIEKLMSGYFWGSAGLGIDLTYSFMDANSIYGTDYNISNATLQKNNIQNPSDIFKSTVRDALELFSSVTLLNFSEVTDTSSTVGHLRFGTTSVTDSAFAWLPYTNWDAAGDIWFSSTSDYYNYSYALMDGTYWNQTIIHEIGHALGLSHTQDASQYGGRTYGTDSSYGGIHNAIPYSTMAYPEYVGEPLDGAENKFSLPTTLMMDDIAALQHLYGVNEQHNSGNDTYTRGSFDDGTLNGLYGDNNIYATIWDAGGEDTFSWSDQTTVASINLNDGEFSCFGNITGPDDTDLDNRYLLDGDGILGIAYDAVIENAIGGSNTDTILGNESDNKLYGGTGSGVKDTLTGGAGADTFICSISDATTDITLADIITDFTAGTDKIGLEDKTVAELSWSDTSGGTQIYETSTSKILFYLNSVSASAIDEDDFVQTDFA